MCHTIQQYVRSLPALLHSAALSQQTRMLQTNQVVSLVIEML